MIQFISWSSIQQLKEALRESEEQSQMVKESLIAAMNPEDVTVAAIAKELSSASVSDHSSLIILLNCTGTSTTVTINI